jgi:uncharacterized protein YbjT (DUF2867 family)
VRPALEPFGVGDVEVVVGDVTDPAAVERAMAGCDALLHAASVFSFDPRRAGEAAGAAQCRCIQNHRYSRQTRS